MSGRLALLIWLSPAVVLAAGAPASDRPESHNDGLHLSGDLYIDTGYEQSLRGLKSEKDVVFWLQQGRFMLQAMALRSSGDLFFQAQAQVLAHIDEIDGDQHIDTDDAWAKFGQTDSWDIQLGRYEAWEVYHKGQGLERDTLEDLGAHEGPDIYEVNYAFYRQNGFGQAAAHLYPTDWVRFELGTVFGNDLKQNSIGVRPVGILEAGIFRLKLAGEWRQTKHEEADTKQEDEARGFGGGFELVNDGADAAVPMRLGINAAYGIVDRIESDGDVDVHGSTDTLSVGGFLDLEVEVMSMGLGANWTRQGDRQENDKGENGQFDHLQTFVSLKRPIIVPEATAKIVFSYAKAALKPAKDNSRDNEMFSVRLRILYVF